MKIAILDIETTDFLDRGGLIVEVGIATLCTLTGEIHPALDVVCRERGLNASHRDAWIFHNSDMTVEEARNAMSFEEVVGPVTKAVLAEHDTATAFNRKFDFGFMQSRGIPHPPLIPCPMLLATPVCKVPHKQPGRRGYKWPSVEEAWQYFFPDEPYVEAHRGCDNAMHEARIVKELIRLGCYKDHVPAEGGVMSSWCQKWMLRYEKGYEKGYGTDEPAGLFISFAFRTGFRDGRFQRLKERQEDQ